MGLRIVARHYYVGVVNVRRATPIHDNRVKDSEIAQSFGDLEANSVLLEHASRRRPLAEFVNRRRTAGSARLARSRRRGVIRHCRRLQCRRGGETWSDACRYLRLYCRVCWLPLTEGAMHRNIGRAEGKHQAEGCG